MTLEFLPFFLDARSQSSKEVNEKETCFKIFCPHPVNNSLYRQKAILILS